MFFTLFFSLVVCCAATGRPSHHAPYTSASPPVPFPSAALDAAPRHLVVHAAPSVTLTHVKTWADHTDDAHYIPHNTFVVFASPRDVLERAGEANLLSIHELHPALKTAPRRSPAPCTVLDVLLSTTSSTSLVARVGHRLGVTFRKVDRTKRRKLRVWLHAANVSSCGAVVDVLTAQPEVRWVERVRNFLPQNNVATWTMQSDVPMTHPVWARNLTGMGMVIALGDTGLDYDSCFFRDPSQAVAFHPAVNRFHRKILSYLECIDDSGNHEHMDGNGAHGTHVSGSAAGRALPDTDQMFNYNGMAPDAKIFFTDLTCGDDQSLYLPSDMGDYYAPGHDMGAMVCSNSWGSDDSPTSYTSTDRETDIYAYANQDYLAVFAAGNQPTTGILSPAASKNVLTVGAHYNDADTSLRDNLAGFSALGPTYDQRVKPEIIGPGQPINSARSDGVLNSNQCDLEQKGGTSMATPHIAGSALLSRQYFLEGYYPTGRRLPQMSLDPSGSLLKAFVIHGAHAMLGTQSGQSLGAAPSRFQGWGRLELNGLLYFADKGNTNHLHVRNNVTLAQSETLEVCVSVNADSPSDVKSLRATIAWLDAATVAEGAPSSIVNDLDLIIVDSLGQIYFPNNMGMFDAVNIVEQVSVAPAISGQWRIYVYGHHVPENGPYGGQPFSLVVSAPGIEVVQAACVGACPAGCSGHGTCANGRCTCHPQYHHVDCSKCNGLAVCNGNGGCDDATKVCACGPTFVGSACESCKPGWFGPRCDGDCLCGALGKCDFQRGHCNCIGHYGGSHCDRCSFDWRGAACDTPSKWCTNRQVRVVTDAGGWLQINGYDTQYANSQTCSWSILAPNPSWRVKLQFVDFVVEDVYDFVKIYDGPNADAPLIKKLTGHNALLPDIISTGSSLFVKFESDLVGTDVGFNITYTILSECSDLTTCNAHGRCTSDNFCACDGDFDPKYFCKTRLPTPAPPTRPGAPTTSPPVPVLGSCSQQGLVCSGHGVCAADQRSCLCDEMYTGDRCELMCPSISNAPCSNHGTCNRDATCTCTDPFTGHFCQVNPAAVIVMYGLEQTRYRTTIPQHTWSLLRVSPSRASSRLRLETSLVGNADAELAMSLWLGSDNAFFMPRAEWNNDTPMKTANRYCIELGGTTPDGEYYVGVYAKTAPCDVIFELLELDGTPAVTLTQSECVPHKVVADYPVDTLPVSATKASQPHSHDAVTDFTRSEVFTIITAAATTIAIVVALVAIVIGARWGVRKIQSHQTRGELAVITEAEMEERIP